MTSSSSAPITPTATPVVSSANDTPSATRAVPPTVSRGRLWTGWILSGLPALFLGMDGVMKLIKPAPVLEATVQLGYPESTLVGIGVVLLASVAFYLVPRTAVLGAILLTGYLGGAIATHVRIGNPLFSHVLFPVYFALLLWGGLWLRDARLRRLIPLRGEVQPR